MLSALDSAIQRKMFERGAIATSGMGIVRAGIGITLVISIEDTDDIITTI